MTTINAVRCKLLALLLCSLSAAAPGFAADRGHEQQVRRLMAAFNAQDADAMAALLHADIEWFNVRGDKISTEARGRTALRDGMSDYFKSCPSCRSKLARLIHSGQRVSAVEIASWESKTGRRSQRSLSVYEFEQGLIRRVYYFPVEP